jgi:hypothetical protein
MPRPPKTSLLARAAAFLPVTLACLLLFTYSGWMLYGDLRSYSYRPTEAIQHSLAVKPGRRSNLNFSYAYTDATGRQHKGYVLSSGLNEAVGPVAEWSLNRWYARWKDHPTVYYDTAQPQTSRAVRGLTASYSAATWPLLSIGCCWAVMRRRENNRHASGPQRRYSTSGLIGGIAGTLSAAGAAQTLYITTLWVEHGWIMHAALTAGALGGTLVAVLRSKRKTQRWQSKLAAERAAYAEQWRSGETPGGA